MSWMVLDYPCEGPLVAPVQTTDHEQGLDKLRRTHGAWLEHIRQARAARVRASVCSWDIVLDPIMELG